MQQSYGIKPVPTTVRNPKSNRVIEQVYLTMGDMLQTITFTGTDWFHDMQCALDAIAWAVHTTINPNIKHSPCHLAFNQDMISHCTVAVDWELIYNDHHQLVEASNINENKSRLPEQYSPGDQVLIILDPDKSRSQPKMKPKMNAPMKDPFTITCVHNNGTVEINRGSFIETLNIRLIKSYLTT